MTVGPRILAARRTAVCPRGGALSEFATHELAAPVIRAVLADAGINASDVDELVLSNGLGAGGNPARVAALAAGLPERVAGLSIDRQCAGGLDAIGLAAALVSSGQARVVIAGGVESYSRRPARARPLPDGSYEPYDRPPFSPYPERDPEMADAAADLADMLSVSRERQDAWAIESHARARAATHLSEEIVPIGEAARDSFTRNLTPKLAARAPRIVRSITNANAAVAADAAGFCLVVADDIAPDALRISGWTSVGGDPACPGLAPVAAIKKLFAARQIAPSDLAHAEIMEAYAVQAIACAESAGISREIINRGGGALARGHPIGASGAVLAVRLATELGRAPGIGLAAIAAAGGIGTALLLEN